MKLRWMRKVHRKGDAEADVDTGWKSSIWEEQFWNRRWKERHTGLLSLESAQRIALCSLIAITEFWPLLSYILSLASARTMISFYYSQYVANVTWVGNYNPNVTEVERKGCKIKYPNVRKWQNYSLMYINLSSYNKTVTCACYLLYIFIENKVTSIDALTFYWHPSIQKH